MPQLLALTVALYAFPAAAQEEDEEAVYLEDVPEVWYEWTDPADPEGMQLVLDHLAPSWGHAAIGELGLGPHDFDAIRELGILRELGALEAAGFDLHIVELVPDGLPEGPTIVVPDFESGGTTDPSTDLPFPTGDDLVSADGSSSSQDGWDVWKDPESGNTVWTRESYDEETKTRTRDTMFLDPAGEPYQTTREVENESTGAAVIHEVTYDKDDKIETTIKAEPPEIIIPKGEEDPTKLPPAEGGEGAGYCPLTLWFCRDALEKLGEDALRLIDAGVRVAPAESDDQPEGVRLIIDPETLVIDPDAVENDGSAAGPRDLRMRIPVVVLPPKPG